MMGNKIETDTSALAARLRRMAHELMEVSLELEGSEGAQAPAEAPAPFPFKAFNLRASRVVYVPGKDNPGALNKLPSGAGQLVAALKESTPKPLSIVDLQNKTGLARRTIENYLTIMKPQGLVKQLSAKDQNGPSMSGSFRRE